MRGVRELGGLGGQDGVRRVMRVWVAYRGFGARGTSDGAARRAVLR